MSPALEVCCEVVGWREHGGPLSGRPFFTFKANRIPMLEIAIALVVGFALGYGVRAWISYQRHQAESGVAVSSNRCRGHPAFLIAPLPARCRAGLVPTP
jgi:hypothetical protein